MNTKALRQKVLDLAIHGKLVPQNSNDESATVLLEKFRAEKAEKIKKGELKADKKDSFIFVGSDKRHYEQFTDGTVKDIEDEIPFEVPDNWAWCRLPEIAVSIFAGGDKPTICEKTKTNECTIPIFSNGIENNGLYGYTNKANVEIPSVTISARGTIGFTCVREEPFMPIVRLITITPNYGINLYYLKAVIDSLLVVGEGSSIPQLTVPTIKEFILPLPPENEQKNIVEAITAIFENIDSLNKEKYDLQTTIKNTKSKILDLAIHGKLVPQDPNDETAEELLKRIATSDNRPYEKVVEEPFEIPDSWKWIKLNDLAEIARGGSPRPIQDYITEDKNGINWIKIGDTSEESKYITSAKEKIKPEGKRHSRFVHAGDFLLTNSMSFGRPYILKIDGCIHDGWLVFANIKEYLLQDYLYYALSSAYIYETFSNVAAGSTVKNLKSDTVKQVNFPLPPLPEQQRIVEAIENMYEVLDQIQNNLI